MPSSLDVLNKAIRLHALHILRLKSICVELLHLFKIFLMIAFDIFHLLLKNEKNGVGWF